MGFEAAIEKLLPEEGGYVHDRDDTGGETIWGVTIAVARAFGYLGRMSDMPREEAIRIYRERYWNALRCDSISKLSERIADEVFDTGVNQGIQRSAEYLQRCLNVFNRRGMLFTDIEVDGRIGPMTIAALREFLALRAKEGERVMLKALNCLQGAFYIELAEAREKDERFVYGWISRRVA